MVNKRGGAVTDDKQRLLNLIDSMPENLDLTMIELQLRRFVGGDPAMRFDFGNGRFDHNFEEEKYDLVRDVEPLGGTVDFDIIQFLNKGESSVCGYEMLRRSALLGGNLGQRDAERFIRRLDKIPKRLREYCIVFPGTIWSQRRTHLYHITYMNWDGWRWFLGIHRVDDEWGLMTRLLVPRLFAWPRTKRFVF